MLAKTMLRSRPFVIYCILLIFSVVHTAQAQHRNPYLELRADSVVIYDLVTEGGAVREDLESNNFYRKQARLDGKSIKKLSKKLGKKRSFGVPGSMCFDPHLGIVYYQNGGPIAIVNVCLDCNNLESSLELRSQVREKINDDGTKGEYLSGMSKSFRKFLNALMVPHNFSHQIVPGQEPWD
jgi:hypothetical protein